MKVLIIHPDDRSTDFLIPIYDNIFQATVVIGGVSRGELIQLINQHDRIIMLGHGSPHGLFSVGQFIGNNSYIIDELMVPLLLNKECIFIWCNADQFVKKHKLNGFYSGMFISEVSETAYCGLLGTSQETVTESNNYFAILLGEIINEPLDVIYKYVKENYGMITENNSIAKYNYNRLYLAE